MIMCSPYPSFWETLPTIWEAPCPPSGKHPAHHLGSTLLACPPFGKHPAHHLGSTLPTIWEAPCPPFGKHPAHHLGSTLLACPKFGKHPAHHLGSTLTDILGSLNSNPNSNSLICQTRQNLTNQFSRYFV